MNEKNCELNEEQLEQVSGGAEEGEIQVMFCSKGCNANREFRCTYNNYWVCTVCGRVAGAINIFA